MVIYIGSMNVGNYAEKIEKWGGSKFLAQKPLTA